MKILFTISSLNTGGAEKILTTLANHFETLGHSVSILIISKDKPFFPLSRTINLIGVDIPKSSSKLLSRVTYIPKLINAIRKNILFENPDIVISFMSEMNILSIVASKLSKKPILVSERSAYDFLDIKPFWKKLRRIVYPFANGLVVLTDADKERYSFVKNRYKIENPLILQEKYTNLQRENVILSVGRLNYVKGFDMLIEAFAKTRQKEWRLKIVGEGKERQNLEELIKKLNLEDRVELVGQKEDVEYFYKKASIFVLSSRTEGFPGVLCEAMGYGCAVIAFDSPSAPREIISHEKDGILIEAKNVKALTKSMDSLMIDSSKRLRLGKNGQKIVERLDIDKIANKWLDIIENIRESV